MSSSSRRRRAAAALLTLAQAGQAQWFFGNLYEAVVKVPDRLASQRDLAVPAGQPVTVRAIMRAGSPVRYYLPAGPVTAGATLAALAVGWDSSCSRRWLAASAVASLSGVALTAYIVREVNIGLFFASEPPTPAERAALLRRWHRVNMIRLAVTGAAWAAAQRAKSGTPRAGPAAGAIHQTSLGAGESRGALLGAIVLGERSCGRSGSGAESRVP